MRPLHSLALASAALLVLAACQPQAVIAPTPIGVVRGAASRDALMSDVTLNTAFQGATPISPDLISAADAEYLLLQNIYARLVPSVVNVDVTLQSLNVGIGDQASGSGFVYGLGATNGEGDTLGYIVTNAHVVSDAQRIRITFHDGYVADAELVGFDVYSDIAVLRVETDAARLLPVTFGDSDALRVGQRAIAIGNPFGLASSMTVGIVSALGRQLPSAELISSTVGGFNNPSIIQVDADINPGNSGGPLLNSAGELIGVNTAIRTESGVFSGVGFSVPANTVARVVPELIERGRVEYAFMGISSLPAEDGYGVAGLVEALSLPVDAGVLIDSITPGSPAANAGLRGGSRLVVVRGREVCAGGDIVAAIDGVYLRTMDEMVAYLVVNSRPGDVVNLLVVRGDETLEVSVTLEARPTESGQLPVCGG